MYQDHYEDVVIVPLDRTWAMDHPKVLWPRELAKVNKNNMWVSLKDPDVEDKRIFNFKEHKLFEYFVNPAKAAAGDIFKYFKSVYNGTGGISYYDVEELTKLVPKQAPVYFNTSGYMRSQVMALNTRDHFLQLISKYLESLDPEYDTKIVFTYKNSLWGEVEIEGKYNKLLKRR